MRTERPRHAAMHACMRASVCTATKSISAGDQHRGMLLGKWVAAAKQLLTRQRPTVFTCPRASLLADDSRRALPLGPRLLPRLGNQLPILIRVCPASIVVRCRRWRRRRLF